MWSTNIFLIVLKGFTGIDQAYEEPAQADLALKTVDNSVHECIMEVIQLLENAVSAVSRFVDVVSKSKLLMRL